MFWRFVDEVEPQLAPGENYAPIRPFAAKLPEHAARLGAAIAAYQDLDFPNLSGEAFQRGVQVASYYASEAKRLTAAFVQEGALL
jgi:hypothetical protein